MRPTQVPFVVQSFTTCLRIARFKFLMLRLTVFEVMISESVGEENKILCRSERNESTSISRILKRLKEEEQAKSNR